MGSQWVRSGSDRLRSWPTIPWWQVRRRRRATRALRRLQAGLDLRRQRDPQAEPYFHDYRDLGKGWQ